MENKWILYKTINLLNDKIYIGVHKLADTRHSKNYLGSGNVLKPAIKKYGKVNFTRTALFEFSCSEDAYKAEAEMVTEEFCSRENTYNIKVGGKGNSGVRTGYKWSEERKAKISAAQSIAMKGNQYFLGKTHSQATKNKFSISKTGAKNPASIAVVIDGKHYDTASSAALAEGVTLYVILYRVRNANPKYEGYSFAPPEGQGEAYPPSGEQQAPPAQ